MSEGDRFRALAEVCEAVGVLQEPDAILAKTLELVARHLGLERVIVFLCDAESGRLVPSASRGVGRAELDEAVQVSRSALDRALEGKGLLYLEDAAGLVGDGSRSMAALGIRSLVAAPVLVRGKAVGVVYADTREGQVRLGDEDLAFARAFAGQLGVALENARLYGRLRSEAREMKRVYEPIARKIRDRFHVRNLIGRSPAFRQVVDLVDKLRTGRTTVLVLGENGTGKELVARAIHYQSDRAERPFVALNCAAIPEGLLEAELFGIEEGVATGVQARTGRFEDADGGTLFLDEVGDMAPAVQAKVLRVLQERTVEKVGGKATIPVDVRVIAATSRPIERMVREGAFREDLWFRLAVFPIRLPRLAERAEDVPDLARHFLARAAAEHGRGPLVLSDEALGLLVRHGWPGNVRELENVIERAVLLSAGPVVGPEAFAGSFGLAAATRPENPSGAPGLEAFLGLGFDEGRERLVESFERGWLERVLREHGGNVTAAARATGMRRQRIHDLLNRLGLDPSAFKPGR